jgi:uncharacterized protein (DUF2249 family)
MFPIESDIPVPVEDRASYPFNSMEAGDSFRLEDTRAAEKARRAATVHQKRHGGRFSVRKTEDGYRLWRIE